MIKMLIIAISMCFAGCATNQFDVALAEANNASDLAYYDAQLENVTSFSCDGTCTLVLSNDDFKAIVKDANGWDFASTLVESAASLSPWFFSYKMVDSALDRTGDSTDNSVNTNDSYNPQNTNAGNDVTITREQNQVEDHTTSTSTEF